MDTMKQLMNNMLDIELAVQPIITKCRENTREAANSMDGTKVRPLNGIWNSSLLV